MSAHPLQFKVATEEWEFEQVHQLNYRTFVEEIPQHQASSTPRLVDKFHGENTYLVCLCGNQVVGMIAARGRRPFSLDQKLPDLDSYLPPGRRACGEALSVRRPQGPGERCRSALAQHERRVKELVSNGAFRQSPPRGRQRGPRPALLR